MKKEYLKKLIKKSALAIFLLSSWLVYSQVTFTQTYNYTGVTQTFTVPANVSSITIQTWGGGGGGAGGTTTSARGGGGGGAYSRGTISVTSGTAVSITIGAGGSGASNPGIAGGTTSVSYTGTVRVSALGGSGAGNNGGAGGLATGTIPGGGTRFAGGTGGNRNQSGSGGGGGGSAGYTGAGGTGGNGNANNGAGGTGGAAGTGTPSGAVGGIGGTRGNNNAGAGIVPGSGGGGRGSNSSNVSRNGGNGASGRVIITYVINYVDLSVTHAVSPGVNTTAGQAVTFTVTIKNNNLTLGASDVVLTSLLPSGYTFISANQAAYNKNTGVWNIGNLAANATTTLTITALVKDTGIYNMTSSVASTSMPDDVPANNTVTTNMTVCKGGSLAPPVKL